MNDHVGKPFYRADLYAVIDRWRRADGTSEIPEPSAPADGGSFDQAVFDDLLDMHASSGVRLLGSLDEGLGRSLTAEPDSAAARALLRRAAHILVSPPPACSASQLCRWPAPNSKRSEKIA